MLHALLKLQTGLRQQTSWQVLAKTVAEMSVFTKKLNPLTGAAEWVRQDEDYDFHQEIARSAFADMLHDTERNDKYYSAIKAVVEQTHQNGRKAHVLDIGTGTGLLAMMAARCGADAIYACEAFSPISECAERVIRDNGLSESISVVHKRSTEMTVGEGGDMPQRANILVTEVFDTELIGEGAISTFNHAHKHLLERDCLVVPTSGTVYAQVVACPSLQRWHRLAPWSDVHPSRAVARCPGAASVHDLQLNQVPKSDFQEITLPQPVFHFDWTCRSPIPEEETSVVETAAVASGTAEMVFMWWSLNMDPQNKEVLSCAPWWAHPRHPTSKDSAPWRDHWMQAVYYLPTPVVVTRGQTLSLVSSHDEFSLWFNVSSLKCEGINTRPVCDCMLHVTCSRTRLGMLNDPSRQAKYLQVLQKVITPQTIVLSFGDTSLLGLQAAKLGANKVYQVEENVMSREIMEELVKDNNLKSTVTILHSTKIDEKIRASVNLVLGEPYFLNTLYPWDVLRFWFLRQQCPAAASVPVSASLFALPMQFQHLQKIRSPLGNISGFKMAAFDELIESSSAVSDSQLEVQPLWEYPGVSLSEPAELLTFALSRPLPGSILETKGSIPLSVSGTCHGVALWLDFQLSFESECRVSMGPQTEVSPGSQVCWDPHSRQGLYFLPSQSPGTASAVVNYTASFSPTNGELSFNFSIQK